MNSLEDKLLYDDVNVDKERIQSKYLPLKQELAQLDKQIKDFEKPSNNLKRSEVDKVIWGLSHLGDLSESLSVEQKKQFLRFFIKKVFIDCAENKIANYELVEEFETLVSSDLVRISSHWLLRLDSNQ